MYNILVYLNKKRVLVINTSRSVQGWLYRYLVIISYRILNQLDRYKQVMLLFKIIIHCLFYRFKIILIKPHGFIYVHKHCVNGSFVVRYIVLKSLPGLHDALSILKEV